MTLEHATNGEIVHLRRRSWSHPGRISGLAVGVGGRGGDLDERFSSKVDKRGPIIVAELGRCWVWTGSQGSGGYGQFRLSKPRRLVYAHRFAYELVRGPIPADLEVFHACRNHACVNPRHLEQVDTTTRVLRGQAPPAKQARQDFCKNGHPLVAENVYTRPGSPSRRECRTCIRERQRARRAAARRVGTADSST